MSYLDILYGQLQTEKNKLATYKEKLNVQKKRKEDIKRILSSLYSVASDDSDEINGYLNKMIANYTDALGGVSAAESLSTATEADKDKGSSDVNLSDAINYLNTELSKVGDKIEELQTNITTTQNTIDNLNSSIRAEEARIERERQEEEERRRQEEERKRQEEANAKAKNTNNVKYNH